MKLEVGHLIDWPFLCDCTVDILVCFDENYFLSVFVHKCSTDIVVFPSLVCGFDRWIPLDGTLLRVAFLLMYVYCCFRHAQWLVTYFTVFWWSYTEWVWHDLLVNSLCIRPVRCYDNIVYRDNFSNIAVQNSFCSLSRYLPLKYNMLKAKPKYKIQLSPCGAWNLPMWLASCSEAVNKRVPTRGKHTTPFSGYMAIRKWRQLP